MTEEIKVFGINLPIVIIILFVIIVIFAVVLILMYRQLMKISRKYYSITKGTEEKDFEKIILTRFKEMEKMKSYMNKLNRDHKEILLRANSCISRTGLVKYDAFNDLSGELSFSIALLDKDYNGLVITSMHSRESCYTYAKEIINGSSFIALSKEETEAIEKAKTIDEEIRNLSEDSANFPQDDEIFKTLVDYEDYPDPPRKRKKRNVLSSETSSLSERGLSYSRSRKEASSSSSGSFAQRVRNNDFDDLYDDYDDEYGDFDEYGDIAYTSGATENYDDFGEDDSLGASEGSQSHKRNKAHSGHNRSDGSSGRTGRRSSEKSSENDHKSNDGKTSKKKNSGASGSKSKTDEADSGISGIKGFFSKLTGSQNKNSAEPAAPENTEVPKKPKKKSDSSSSKKRKSDAPPAKRPPRKTTPDAQRPMKSANQRKKESTRKREE